MNKDSIKIVEFDNIKHREHVINLWLEIFGYEAAHNAPGLVIDKKLAVNDGLFFVALNNDQNQDQDKNSDQSYEEKKVIGTVMAGYDGHRGWIYSISVHPDLRKQKLGSILLVHAEKKLAAIGCMKINLQIMEGNEAVENFYLANGYLTEQRISMGKRIKENISTI